MYLLKRKSEAVTILHAHVESVTQHEDCHESHQQCLNWGEEGNNEWTNLPETPRLQ